MRSSATAEDLPGGFVCRRCRDISQCSRTYGAVACSASVFRVAFTDRAISYRARLGYDQLKVAISVGVQPMVRSDKASSGVIFTLDTESGFRDVVLISGLRPGRVCSARASLRLMSGLSSNWTLKTGYRPIVGRRLGTKEVRLVYGDGSRTTRSEATPLAERGRFSLTDDEVLKLAHWACLIEEHYSKQAGHPQPMDIEWAKDGVTGKLFVVQARPETVHSAKATDAVARRSIESLVNMDQRW